MNAQVSFLEGTYTLIHIPLDLYPTLLQPLLRILLPQTQSLNFTRDSREYELEGLTTDYQHGFLNISITPIECSVVCHSSWAKNVFEPALNALPKPLKNTVKLYKDTYMILAVTSAGLDPGGRVMELSSPLAFAGIPIFFITTYYSDFILVPTKEKQKVVQALLAKGFELSENQSNFVNPSMYAPNSSDTDLSQKPPSTPPPSNDDELQARTFKLLLKHDVKARVEPDLELVQCSGREISPLTNAYGHRPSMSRKSSTDYRRSWISHPRFLSLTLAQDDPPSLLLDKALLPNFDDSLVGDTEGVLIPIFLDLGGLSSESTGIVCGVAGRLVKGTDMAESSELSYLSTSRAGTVILSRVQSIRALEILNPLLTKGS
ncbi:ACT domain-containing protein [Trichoderma breve]|uniref:ACT domain-containing protein n=1 Tax=Trichoderma breve TaxID=2034170 RepID=A0A9W9JQL5_9HYPO|nr:ACT domain-containing protein [Trichoderma breve]KAJ4863956.1 ACT domain-containing protein [Trichoderma breve]